LEDESMRTAHYVASTHWDREWYEPFQGYRMRLVSLLDEVIETIERDPGYKTFTTDGQAIPLTDYLEVRPERRELVKRLLIEGRLKAGPWYVLPDEWLCSGESLVRNIQIGMQTTRELGGVPSRAGIVVDQFGHNSQMAQIFSLFNFPVAFAWRGTHEKEHHGHFNWIAADGTKLPTYRFGKVGYCSYCAAVREPNNQDVQLEVNDATIQRLVDFVLHESGRSPVGPILLFDGGDHLEIEPKQSQLIDAANKVLTKHDIKIVHSDLDAYMHDLAADVGKIQKKIEGELRESSREQGATDEHWLIPGTLSSRIHLKQRNAACEDELCIWAEPFSTFAAQLGLEYPKGYLNLAWKHLIENHPHDSICGCSIDQVHQDMIYRFDQSLGISQRLTNQALKHITMLAAPRERAEGSLVLGVFNATADEMNEPVDLEIPLPTTWPKKFQEFFGFEEKFAFKIKGPDGKEIPYQLVGQKRDKLSFRRSRRKFPTGDQRHVISVTAQLKVPAFGYTTLTVEPVDGPTRYLGNMSPAHNVIENENLRVEVNPNGTIKLTDKKTGHTFDQLLTFEDRADIGDGWYHGQAVNDQIFYSTSSTAEVAHTANGINKATLRIITTMNVPKDFHRRTMTRCETLWPMKIISDVTLRQGSGRVEVTTTIDNQVLDHRVRVLLPTNLKGDTYICDSQYDVVERDVALRADNAIRRELDVETRPQVTWTSFGDGKVGLAVVSRGLPESAVRDNEERAIALTLFRGFRRAVLTNDNLGGEIQGKHTFRYDIVPFKGDVPRKRLFTLGQRVNMPVRQIDLLPQDLPATLAKESLPRTQSFFNVEGDVVVAALQQAEGMTEVRFFNPMPTAEKVTLPAKEARAVMLDDQTDNSIEVKATSTAVVAHVPSKKIVTLRLK
jgi:alpha-mannosidase/mannosylglycerate hydrolase